MVDASLKDFNEIHALYDRCFPDDERIPFNHLVDTISIDRPFYAVYDDEQLVGLVSIFLIDDLVYLSYLAVEERFRNKGIGSAIVNMVARDYPDTCIYIDIEMLDEKADNAIERTRRRDFYIRLGFVETGIFYRFYDVDYEILSIHGIVKKENLQRLLQKHWGHYASMARYF